MPMDYSDSTNATSDAQPRPRAIAIISGKGGSGKTMVAAVLARVLDRVGQDSVIVDADTATGGMTYYLGLKLVSNIAVGLADLVGVVDGNADLELPPGAVQPVQGVERTRFFGVGDHRRLYQEAHEEDLPKLLSRVIQRLKRDKRWIVVDCRGGIDRDSVAVCTAVDDILLVVEPDTTSFQASQHVINILGRSRIANKVRGFIINKVFDDPSVVARNGTSVFRSQYLTSVPFDLESMRDFLVGEVPQTDSPFGIHVWWALHRAYQIPASPARVWSFRDFREVGLSNLDSVRGGMLLSALIAMLGTVWMANKWFSSFPTPTDHAVALAALALGFLSGFETFRRALGRALSIYARMLSRMMSSRSDSG